jgi:hypothetical protein
VRRLSAFVLAVSSLCASAGADQFPFRHVIVTDTRLAALVFDGYRRSETLRRLLHEVEDSEWTVFVQSGPCPIEKAIGCLLHTVGMYEGRRYLRLKTQPERHHPDVVLALVGHELQHAIEVVSAGDVHDAPAMTALFRRIGSFEEKTSQGRLFETTAARRIECKIRCELRRPVRQVSIR